MRRTRAAKLEAVDVEDATAEKVPEQHREALPLRLHGGMSMSAPSARVACSGPLVHGTNRSRIQMVTFLV